MRITTVTLFLVFAVLLDSFELISSIKTLEDLFPGYNGVLPPIEDVSSETIGRLRHFGKLGLRNIETPDGVFLARAHFIVGYKTRDSILPLCFLFGQLNRLFVFDTTKDQWDEMHADEFHKLGPGRLFSLVRARDDAAATHVLASKASMRDKRAHIEPCNEANRATDKTEIRQEEYMRRGIKSLDESIRAVKE